MVSERDEQFHDLLERFVDVIVDTEGFTREKLVGILVDVANFFNLSKGVTEFYENLWHEQLGKGEIFIDYDDGRESKVIISLRVVTSVLSVVKCSLYHPVDAEELSEDEYKKLNLVPGGLSGLSAGIVFRIPSKGLHFMTFMVSRMQISLSESMIS